MNNRYPEPTEAQQRILQQKRILEDQRNQIAEIRSRSSALQAAHLQRIQEYEMQLKLLEAERALLQQRQRERHW